MISYGLDYGMGEEPEDRYEIRPLEWYADLLSETTAALRGPHDDAGRMSYHLITIHSRPELRGLGYASALLKMICADADAIEAVLTLEVAAPGKHNPSYHPSDLPDATLAAWYSRHGFVVDESMHSPRFMRRDPR